MTYTAVNPHACYNEPRPNTSDTRALYWYLTTFRWDLFTTIFTAQMGCGKLQCGIITVLPEEEEEKKDELFVSNDTIEGPRTSAVKPGRITQA